MSAVSAIGIGCSTLWIAGILPFHIGIALFLLLGFATGSFFVALAMTIASDVPKSGTSIICKYIDMIRCLMHTTITDVSSAMLMQALCRFIGTTIGLASVAAIVQSNIKVLLHKRITGPDADEVCQK